jgi:hypothetical protein
MTDYIPYPPASMSYDFELYSNHEQQLDMLPTSQPFLPSTSYTMDSTFSAPYDHMASMSEAPRPQDLQFHYDGIAQGVKSHFPQYTSPTGSPNSASHSSHDQPPNLSASSESGASVSSSAMGSPSLNTQFNEPWNPMANGLGLTSGFEYAGIVEPVKVPGCVGESSILSSRAESPPSFISPSTPTSEASNGNVFKSPSTPASAKWSAQRTSAHATRRNSLLSNEVRAYEVPSATSHFLPAHINSTPPLSQTKKSFISRESSCWFPSALPSLVGGLGEEQNSNSEPLDPNLVQFGHPLAYAPPSPYPEIRTQSPYFGVLEHPPSPAPSHISSHSQRPGSRSIKRGSQSPYLDTQRFQPYPTFNGQRRRSDASLHSQHSGTSRKSGSSYEIDDETREKGLCPLPECGRVFKDLKAHMLTHQTERPEKCPIATCEYHLKGFARKYDKNRHTLTHYKGTMVCGFCPGSGSAAEKSFNRADVFKRHLTSVHGVEQNPPNSRKKSPTGRKAYTSTQQVAGTCSTCSVTFANAQEFYEHLDDCVLRVVQQADPSEAINQRLLTSVAEDKNVSDTLDRNGLSNSVEYTVPSYDDDDDDASEEEFDVDDVNDDTYGVRRSRSGKGSLKANKSH